jgi:hypothetical protein
MEIRPRLHMLCICSQPRRMCNSPLGVWALIKRTASSTHVVIGCLALSVGCRYEEHNARKRKKLPLEVKG